MPTLVFNKCCGCIELKTGCFIIGYLNLVGYIILTVVMSLALVGGAVVAGSSQTKDIDTRDAGIIISVAAGILLIFVLLALAFAIVLLVGLHKNKPGHLKAYLIYSVIFLVVTIIHFIANSATSAHVKAGDIVQSLLTILLSIYFLLVIRSMYFQMKDPARGPAIYSAA